MNRKGLEEKRNDLEQEMKDLVANSKKENRAMDEKEVARFDEIEKEIKNIDATIEREDKVNDMEEKEIKKEETNELTAEEKRFYKTVEERDDYKRQLNSAFNNGFIPKKKIKDKIKKLDKKIENYREKSDFNMATNEDYYANIENKLK